jgi:Tfp pilus assembly protein PilV
VLIAVVILALAVAGVGTMVATAINADTASQRYSAAAALALAKLEQLRSLPRTHPDWAAGAHSEPGLEGDGSLGGGPYTRSWQVELDYNGYDHLHRVAVTVSHDESGQSVTVASLYWR